MTQGCIHTSAHFQTGIGILEKPNLVQIIEIFWHEPEKCGILNLMVEFMGSPAVVPAWLDRIPQYELVAYDPTAHV